MNAIDDYGGMDFCPRCGRTATGRGYCLTCEVEWDVRPMRGVSSAADAGYVAEWVRANEHKPQGIVLVRFDNGAMGVAYWSANYGHWDCGPQQFAAERVTHWTCLPAPPAT